LASRFRYSWVREELKWRLMRRGFYVHLHAYDYLVMHENSIVCTIHLLPELGEAYVNRFKLNPISAPLVSAVSREMLSLDPRIREMVRDVPQRILA